MRDVFFLGEVCGLFELNFIVFFQFSFGFEYFKVLVFSCSFRIG